MQNTTPPPTAEERIAALETMLRYLIDTLEGEPHFTAEALLRWANLCRERERAHGIADARAQVAFAQLCERLQLIEDSTQAEAADPAAQQAAAAAISKAHRPQKD